MSNSGLASYVIISPYKTVGRNHAIDTITIHCMAGQMTATACGQWFQKSGCSSNYGIGSDGSIGLYVEEKDRSWASSSASNDNRAITIEVASSSEDPYVVNDAAYNSLIDLLVDICQRNGIDQLRWKGDPNLIGQVDKQNMTVHRWFKKKACPGDYLYNKHTEIANAVNARMDAPLIPPLDDVSSTNTYSDSESATASYTSMSMTSPNSRLATYINRTGSERCSPRPGAITAITVHIAKKRGDINILSKMVNSGSTTYNYGIDSEGVIGMFVDEPLKTNATANTRNDKRALNIVCMNESLSPDYSMSDATYDALIELCADICRRNYIPSLTFTGNNKVDSLTLHSEFDSSVDCPGPWFLKRIDKFVKAVNEQLQKDWATSNARIAISNESALYIQSGVNIDAIKPYVIALDQRQIGIDYSKMRDIGVVGVMLDGGMRLNKKHELVDYRSVNIYKQCEEVKKAKLPFGIYYTSHAQDVNDAKEECYWLRFIISKYPPKLGVWLHCDFDESLPTARAMSIVEKYYSSFVEWGLKSKCGIYATKKQAKLINWPRQCTYMPLWLEGEMTDAVCPEDEILTPSFFQLSNLENEGYKKGTEVLDPFPQGGASTDSIGDSFYNSNVVSVSTGLSEQVYGDYTMKSLPSSPYYTGTKKYERYTAISSVSSRQYQICRSDKTTTNSEGFRIVDNRYLFACGTGITGTVGTYVDVILDNGTVIPCIVGDIKADVHTDAATGHVYTSVNNNWCCSEFIVDGDRLNAKVKSMSDCSYLTESWRSPVVKMKVYTKNWFD